MKYTGLTDERNKWRRQIKAGLWHEPYILQQYRINRESNLWRSTREVEKLCEYVLFLEGATTMSEQPQITLNNEALETLLRSNLSCYMGKSISQDLLGEITHQIMDSIDFFLNKKDEEQI